MSARHEPWRASSSPGRRIVAWVVAAAVAAAVRTTLLLLVTATSSCARSGEVLRPADGGDPTGLPVTDVRLSTGQNHACVVIGGTLRCWGEPGDVRLVPTPQAGGPPITVPGGPWTVPAAGELHTCALAADGGVFCWGGNASGQLGVGDRENRLEPTRVALPARAVDVRTAFSFTCALLADASVWCWGYNFEGQLGLGDTYPGEDRATPVQLGTDRDWTFVATGQGHACGVRSPGRLFCWGRNHVSQLGQGTSDPVQLRAPVMVGSDADWAEVGCSQNTTCARKRDGSLWCWGEQASGALAVGDVDPRPSPARVPGEAGWFAMSAGTFHTCGLRAGGQLWCAGRNAEGQLGSPEPADSVPGMIRADPGTDWIEVRAGRLFTCARKADESVWCMGNNSQGELAADPALTGRSAAMLRVPLPP